MGMCGPLVMMLGKHHFRHFYFIGRTLSFALAGGTAGGAGAVLYLFLHAYHIPALACFFFGSIIWMIGWGHLFGLNFIWLNRWKAKISKASQPLSLLLLKDHPGAVFLFGFFTVLLPCGQTLIVFSACALSGDAIAGFANGCFFALATSPSLYASMQAHRLFSNFQHYYDAVMGISALGIGSLALCRGLAELGIIPHLVLSQEYHLVIF
jgi:sulfite exporter TauE/SafE